jgi:hypothetical protein
MRLPFSKDSGAEQIPLTTAITIFLAAAAFACSAVALYIAAGPVMEEQLALRNEFMELKAQQSQVNIQYEAWLKKAKREINAAQEIQDAAGAKAGR